MKLTFRIQKIEVHKDMYRVIYPKDRQGFEADFFIQKVFLNQPTPCLGQPLRQACRRTIN